MQTLTKKDAMTSSTKVYLLKMFDGKCTMSCQKPNNPSLLMREVRLHTPTYLDLFTNAKKKTVAMEPTELNYCMLSNEVVWVSLLKDHIRVEGTRNMKSDRDYNLLLV